MLLQTYSEMIVTSAPASMLKVTYFPLSVRVTPRVTSPFGGLSRDPRKASLASPLNYPMPPCTPPTLADIYTALKWPFVADGILSRTMSFVVGRDLATPGAPIGVIR